MKRIDGCVFGLGKLLLILLTSGCLCPYAMGQAQVQGQWATLPYTMPINPIHVSLLHNGKVLIVSGSGAYAPNTSYEAAVWDPQAGTITTQPVGWDMFCNEMAVMPDGRPFVLDGTLQYDPFYGSPNTAAYDPNTGNFVELQGMAHGRWYPTVTTLGDGRMMVFSGLNETGRTNRALEIYTVGRRVEHAVHRALESAALPSHAPAAEWHGVLFWPWANIQHLRSLHSDLDDERGHNQLRRHPYLWLLRPPTPDASVQLPASRDDPRRRQSRDQHD